jgi:hypothetical protein
MDPGMKLQITLDENKVGITMIYPDRYAAIEEYDRLVEMLSRQSGETVTLEIKGARRVE